MQNITHNILEGYPKQFFSNQEIHEIFSKTQGLCYTCLNQIGEKYYMSENTYSWFIVNRSNDIVFGQKEKDQSILQPICEKCLDKMRHKTIPVSH
jgi:hypothetical protein